MILKDEILKLIDGDIHQYAEIDASKISFKKEVVEACKQNYCGRYNKSWLCPPAVGKLDDLRAKYSAYDNALVFTTKSPLEDSFDIESMEFAREAHQAITRRVIPLQEYNDISILGAGGCTLCLKCTYPDSECRFPKLAFPAVEAVGIDVVALASSCTINYHNGVNTVTYFSVILY